MTDTLRPTLDLVGGYRVYKTAQESIMLKRKELATAAGVHPETVRFYEEVGLLPAPLRSRNGYRQYSPAAVERLRFIKESKALGFTLREIQDLMDLKAQNGITCRTSATMVQGKIDELDRKVAAIKAMKRRLVGFRDQCLSREGDEDCGAFSLLDAR